MTDEVLSDIDAERAVLGAVLVRPEMLGEVGRVLEATDFFSPAHAALYEAALGMWQSGMAVDAATVKARLEDSGQLRLVGGAASIVSLMAATPSTRNALQYALRVIEMAARRRVDQACVDARSAVREGVAAAEVAADLHARTDRVGAGLVEAPVDDLVSFEEWVRSGVESQSRWVIPGVMRAEWRMILTAPAGVGKATLMRQIAYASSMGVHPFTLNRIPPVRVLIVDLENPLSSVTGTGKRMIEAAGDLMQGNLLDPWPVEDCLVWSRIAGIDVRSRRDRLELERRIRHAAPDLVCLGPVYKAYRKDSRLSAEEVTMEVCEVFDDLRTRYGFALILEHHSPRGSQELFPFGSSVWERWPEFGKTLRPADDDDRRLIFGSFRPDRVPVTWPGTFTWGAVWPFDAHFQVEVPRAAPSSGGRGAPLPPRADLGDF